MIATSILKLQESKEKIQKIDQSQTDLIHFDVMDGKFVQNKTNYQNLPEFTKPIDIHLMVEDVKKYVDAFSYLHPKNITFHIEINNNIDEIITYIKEKGFKVGLAIKPKTSIEQLLPYLDKIDVVLVMTVEPGAGGQKFMKDMIPKINTLKKMQKDYQYLIEVDGGINKDTKELCNADIFVVGSYITDSDHPNDMIRNLKSI